MNEHLENIKEIRSMMERSSKFLSLSGLSGISAGICALLGASYAYTQVRIDSTTLFLNAQVRHGAIPTLLGIATIVLITALGFGIFFTVQKAHRNQLSIWNNTSKNLLISLAMPLLAGGFFCLGLIYHGLFLLCFPATLVFYGIALWSASKYTVTDTYYLGLAEIILGIIALFVARYYLIFWAFGFGILHIIYGTVMYFKYDRKV